MGSREVKSYLHPVSINLDITYILSLTIGADKAGLLTWPPLAQTAAAAMPAVAEAARALALPLPLPLIARAFQKSRFHAT